MLIATAQLVLIWSIFISLYSGEVRRLIMESPIYLGLFPRARSHRSGINLVRILQEDYF